MRETKELDQFKMNVFMKKMIEIYNAGALNLMISIGHRTGLFDTMAEMPRSTSEQIAAKAGLNERYVKEWLGAMVTGRIVYYNPEDKTYSLPREHAALLTRAATPNNLAVTTQWLSVLGEVEDEIVECFKKGGGVPYSSYNRFHEVMAEESAQTVVSALIDHILPLVPGLPESLRRGIEVLEVGCGSGRALNQMASEFPNSKFIGYDISEEAINTARSEATKSGLTNVKFEVKDVSNIGASERFNLIAVFDAIHDQAKPDKVLREISNALRPDGTFLMQDIAGSSYVHKNLDHQIAPLIYTMSCMHCMTVSLAQGGAGLGAAWGEELALKMLKEAGFNKVEVKQLPHDFINSYFIANK
ncbi:MAG: methyltransferase domain-containing protein [Candidatus Dadabacteria bacterium]|nr:methyltransferase domain-containing protein [Candidatus Dadabacteria bacterium]